jgi:hypothetical protein
MVTARAKNQLLDAVARCLAVACLIAVIFIAFRRFNGADTPFLAFSVIGAAVVHFANRPRVIEATITAVLASGLGIAYVGSRGAFGQYPASGLVGTLAFLGLASMIILGWKACRSTEALRPLLLATLCPMLVVLTNVASAAAIKFQPRVFDLFLYRFDGSLGIQASFLAGRWFAGSPFLANLCFLISAALPLAEVLVFLLFVRGQRMPANPMALFIVTGIAGLAFFQLCPATGPVHAFGAEFPSYPPPFQPLEAVRADDVPRSAMPSLRGAWALLIWWSLRYSKNWMRWLATGFLVLTVLATLGLGENYLIDLVVAVPFAVTAMAACTGQHRKLIAAGALVLAWLLYLRFGLPVFTLSPLGAWMAVLATVIISLLVAGAKNPSMLRGRIPSGGGLLTRLMPPAPPN